MTDQKSDDAVSHTESDEEVVSFPTAADLISEVSTTPHPATCGDSFVQYPTTTKTPSPDSQDGGGGAGSDGVVGPRPTVSHP
jgi:hypothetical protein